MQPKYPIYIPSKGRWESRLTVKELERLGIPYKICIENQEYNNYASVINPDNILVVPHSNVEDGLVRSRNWIWDHAQASGAKRHWQLDDNIQAFWRCNRNLRIRVADGTIFRCCEDFTDRFLNVPQSGMQYYMFARDWSAWPAYYINSRVYSNHLLDNNAELDGKPLRFRGPYNDDTDLSLRIFKSGQCTILFVAFLAQKATTMTVKGGNVPIYVGDGRLKMAQALVDWHPDVTTITRKWGRWQHQVDYRPFKKNKLILKPGLVIPKGINNYGMRLVEITKTKAQKSKALPMVTLSKPVPKPRSKFNVDDYWKDRGFCGTQKLTDSI